MDKRETTITAVTVFVLAVAAGVFFLMADWVIRQVVTFVPHTVKLSENE